MRRLIALVLVGAALLGCVARGESSGLSVSASGEEIRPGKAVVISFSLPRAGRYSLRLRDEAGSVLAVIAEDRQGNEGYNALYWNGTEGGVAAPQGEWRLVLETEAGETAELIVETDNRISHEEPRISTLPGSPGEKTCMSRSLGSGRSGWREPAS